MSIRRKGSGYVVEIYDPATKAKRHVKARDFGMLVPTTERQAKALERAALNARDSAVRTSEETCNSFASRWARDYPRAAESTNRHNAERVARFGEAFAGRPLRSIGADEARVWAAEHRSRVREVRAMLNDAIKLGLLDSNPFAGLGDDHKRGRHEIVVLTSDELDVLTETAVEHHGEEFGVEMAAMINWAAYTCMRPGEIFAAEFSRLKGDVFDLREQFNSHTRQRTIPKHDGKGLIYVPEPARLAAVGKPRRLGDDLIFRTRLGKPFRAGSLYSSWHPVRVAFTAKLPVTHDLRRRLAADPKDWMDFYELRHYGASYMLNVLEIEPWVIAEQLRHKDGGKLVLRLYGHPDRRRAIDRIRRAFGGSVSQIRSDSGDSRETAVGEGA
jgi:integrase